MNHETLQSFIHNEFGNRHDTTWMNHYEYNILAPHIVAASQSTEPLDVRQMPVAVRTTDTENAKSCKEMLQYYREIWNEMLTYAHNISIIMDRQRRNITIGREIDKFIKKMNSKDEKTNRKNYAYRKVYDYLKKRNDENGQKYIAENQYRLQYARKHSGIVVPTNYVTTTANKILPGYGSYINLISFDQFPQYYKFIISKSTTCYSDEVIMLVSLFKLEKYLDQASTFLLDLEKDPAVGSKSSCQRS